MFHELFWLIWNPAQWTLYDPDLLDKFSDLTILYLDNLVGAKYNTGNMKKVLILLSIVKVLETIGLKDITLKELNW